VYGRSACAKAGASFWHGRRVSRDTPDNE